MKHKILIIVIAMMGSITNSISGSFDVRGWYENYKVSHVRPNTDRVYFKVEGFSSDYMYIQNTHAIFNTMVASLIEAQINNLYIDFHTVETDTGFHEVDALDVHE